jgi:hypothetical protein
MKRSSLVLLAALFAASLGASAFAADGLINDALSGDGSSATPAPAVKPADGPPTAPSLVDPDAAKIVDNMDLLKKLTAAPDEQQQNATGAEEQLKDMVDRMGQSENRLGQKDAGSVTQETQRRIVVDLDALIEIARKQCNSQSQSKQQGQPQQRQMSKTSRGQGGATAATNEQLRAGGFDAPESNGQDLHQKSPAEWGNLPDRDRDLLAHGSNSQYLPAYKAAIDRYYQALAEIGRSTRGQ